MRNWVWRLSFAGLWVVLVVAGLWFFRGVLGYACEDCIGGHPGPGGLGYYYGEGGFKTDWQAVVPVSVVFATLGTGMAWVASRGFRQRTGSAVQG